jgi:phosphatidylserine/phosphatidylglycerophosphate/cardiolipin synthase-like enzyme
MLAKRCVGPTRFPGGAEHSITRNPHTEKIGIVPAQSARKLRGDQIFMRQKNTALSLAGFLIVAIFFFYQSILSPYLRKHRTYTPNSVQVFFSPKGGCTDAVVEELERAQKSVLVQAYSFTSPQIAKALTDAKKRGVDVRVILDDSQKKEQYSEADFIAHAGVPTWMDGKHAIAHNKIMIIDGKDIITGSFNFTRQAEASNAENMLVIHETPDLAKAYSENWNSHLMHSEKYTGR